jgi:molybdopterin-guanine dinucleotide biosynthesis protein MobB
LKIIHFLGYSNSGKTHAISFLTKELARKGKRVGTLKHIHDENFSEDRKGKDTWLFRKSGASTVIAISPNKFLVMRDNAGRVEADLDEALRIFRRNGTDYLFIEGFHSLKRKRRLREILCASTLSETLELLKLHKRPICVLGKVEGIFRANDRFRGVRVLILPGDKERLMQLIS